jgi:rhodanese-related sulfurtransferase
LYVGAGRRVQSTEPEDRAMKLVKGVRQMVAEAKSRIRSIDVEEARVRHADPGQVFVDLRDVRELEREGMIPGAFHCPRGMLEFWVDPDSPYHKAIFASGKEFVFYCNGGWRSALAADTAREMGLGPVCELGGGFKAWRDAGLPVAPRPTKQRPE